MFSTPSATKDRENGQGSAMSFHPGGKLTFGWGQLAQNSARDESAGAPPLWLWPDSMRIFIFNHSRFNR